MKKCIKFMSLLCVIALLAGCGLVSKVETKEKETEEKQTNSSEVVVTVGGEEYSMERFNLHFYNAQDELLKQSGIQEISAIPEDFWTKQVDGKTALDIAKEAALTNLINDAIAYQKAKEYNLGLTADEKSEITNQMSSLKQDKVTLSQFEYIGITPEEMEKYYNEAYHMQKLVPELIKRKEIKVDDKAVEEEMAKNYVKAKHILISTVDNETREPLPEDKVKEANKKAAEILERLNAGADFDELMNAESEDPGLATAPDGYLFTTGQMVPEFEETAFALNENEISGLVNTSYGIHILKRVPFDPNGAQEKQTKENLKTNMAMPELEALMKTWKSETEIVTNDEALKNLKPTIINSAKE